MFFDRKKKMDKLNSKDNKPGQNLNEPVKILHEPRFCLYCNFESKHFTIMEQHALNMHGVLVRRKKWYREWGEFKHMAPGMVSLNLILSGGQENNLDIGYVPFTEQDAQDMLNLIPDV